MNVSTNSDIDLLSGLSRNVRKPKSVTDGQTDEQTDKPIPIVPLTPLVENKNFFHIFLWCPNKAFMLFNSDCDSNNMMLFDYDSCITWWHIMD